MKILVFYNSALILSNQDYCIETGTGQFAKELQVLGNKVSVFGQIISYEENSTDVYPLLENGLVVKGVKRMKNKLFLYSLLYFKAIVEIYKADFVYMFYPNAMRFSLFFAILSNKKYGIYIRGTDDLGNFESKLFYKYAYKVLTVADFFSDYVNGFSPKAVASAISPMIIFNDKDIIENRVYSQDLKKFKVLYLGRMTNDKGIIELLKATGILLKQHHLNIELLLVGSGEYLEELKSLAADLEITDYVHFTGPVFNKDEIKKYYEIADVYILPSYHEGFPRTLYEAMICGTPIITTFVGGIAGLMKNKVNCLEIEPKSVESVAQSLKYARENYNEMITLAQNSQITIKNILSTRKRSHAQSLNDNVKMIKL